MKIVKIKCNLKSNLIWDFIYLVELNKMDNVLMNFIFLDPILHQEIIEY